jgi:hypothetical protein
MKALLSFFAAVTLSSGGYSQIMYDINFQTADQLVNQVVTTGPAPEHVSSIWFGTPEVVAAYGPLTDQPLLFDSNGESPSGPYYYTQIGLTFPNVPLSSVDLSFDMVDTGAGHMFTVFFDTPTVRNFYFQDGQISFFDPYFGGVNIGTYQMGQAYRFDIQLDYLLKQWSFMENNILLGTGAFSLDGNLDSIRFNYSANGPNISGTAIDNILVVTVPEPSLLGFMVCACPAFLLRYFRQRKN